MRDYDSVKDELNRASTLLVDVRLVRPNLQTILDDLEQLKQLLGADMSAETPDGDAADAD